MGQPLATLQELVLETFQPLEGRSSQRPEARKKVAGILKTPAKSGLSSQTPSRWPMILSCSLFR
jgi:hypothetical protein